MGGSSGKGIAQDIRLRGGGGGLGAIPGFSTIAGSAPGCMFLFL